MDSVIEETVADGGIQASSRLQRETWHDFLLPSMIESGKFTSLPILEQSC